MKKIMVALVMVLIVVNITIVCLMYPPLAICIIVGLLITSFLIAMIA